MKIARCSTGGPPFWGVVDIAEGVVRPFSGDFQHWAPRLTAGEGAAALAFTGTVHRLAEIQLLPPMDRGPKVIVVGANYIKHLIEFGLEPPPSPVAFMKPYGALIGALDDIQRSPLTSQLDFEVELVAVIGAPVTGLDNPLCAVLGYTVGNDVSARDLQKGCSAKIGMDFFSGKGLDHTTGLGPWIVTRDEFGDTTPDLPMRLRVNGEIRQDGRTGDMRWDVAALLRYVDERSALEPGDVMFTGTPAGVAQGDGRYLAIGDVVEASIDGIGILRNRVASKPV